MSTELVLLVSDLFIPLRNPDIDSQFREIILPNKIQHVICLGNIGNQETYNWLSSLSSDFHAIKGDYDINKKLPDKKVIQIGNFRIGMIHGHQIIPMGDLEILSNIQRELDCDILASGYTHKLSINTKDNKLYLNPGSITGALSPLLENSIPSFILMALNGEEVTIYSYVLSDNCQKFEVGQIEYSRGSDELKIVKPVGEDNISNENINNENKENEEKNIKENEEILEEKNTNIINQNQNNEVKEAENKDEKIDE